MHVGQEPFFFRPQLVVLTPRPRDARLSGGRCCVELCGCVVLFGVMWCLVAAPGHQPGEALLEFTLNLPNRENQRMLRVWEVQVCVK